jgi:hypothetical protein
MGVNWSATDEIPNSDIQAHRTPSLIPRPALLEIEIWNFSGTWMLEFEDPTEKGVNGIVIFVCA